MIIREMNIGDYKSIIDLFEKTPGITIREADSKKSIEIYLQRNPDLNFVVLEKSRIIACIMCGHDGRRGYLQHLVVDINYRKKGIGKKLFEKCIKNLNSFGIKKSHIFVLKDNEVANKFWKNQGWRLRNDIEMYSYSTSLNENI